ncbi:uncharacterized protein TNCV_4278621 [Trichonephila clavipes]|nr:uncharacterized protein TNCV_4278621 [Trichonephila clavipes]
MDSIVTHKSEVSSEEFSIYKWFVHSLVVTGTGHKFFICSWKLRSQFEEEILDILSLLKNSPIRSFKGEPYTKSARLASKTSLRLVLRPRSTVGIYSGHLEENKFKYLVPQPEPKYVVNIWDIVNSKSDTKYKDSKNRLLNLFKESENLRIKLLLTGIELGDMKPSHLLQKLKTAITSDISENLSKTLRLEKLPEPIKNILIVSDAILGKLAVKANKISDMTLRKEILQLENLRTWEKQRRQRNSFFSTEFRA